LAPPQFDGYTLIEFDACRAVKGQTKRGLLSDQDAPSPTANF
jgi:hypothetical protein